MHASIFIHTYSVLKSKWALVPFEKTTHRQYVVTVQARVSVCLDLVQAEKLLILIIFIECCIAGRFDGILILWLGSLADYCQF